jgi:hypothetical protein
MAPKKDLEQEKFELLQQRIEKEGSFEEFQKII